MKKKLLALVLILALAVSALGLVACGGSGFSSTYKNMYSNKDLAKFFESNKVLNSQKDLGLDLEAEELDDWGESNLGVFTTEDNDGNTVYKVYNFETGTVVATFTDAENVDYYIDNDQISSLMSDLEFYDYFYVQKETTDPDTFALTFEYFVYDANGNLIGSDENAPDEVFDTLFIGKDYYRIKKDKFEKAGSLVKNAMMLPEFTDLLDGKYYELNDEGDEYIAIYDDEFNMINYYKLPSYAEVVGWGILNNGNVIVQFACEVPDMDSDYNVLTDNGQQLQKYKVVTEIYNVKKSEMKEIETTFMFRNYGNGNSCVIAVDSFKGLNSKFSYGNVENIARINVITDKRVDENSKIISLGNNGEIDKILFEDFVGQDGGLEPLVSGNFIVFTENGNWLVSEKGDIIANVTFSRFNNKYIVLNGKIYDHDFKELTSFDEDKWNVELMNNTVVLNSVENAKQFKLFANGAFKEITLAEDETLVGGGERYYVIRKVAAEGTTYTYYNENGEALYTSAFALEYNGMTRSGKMLFSGFDVANEKNVNIILYYAAK